MKFPIIGFFWMLLVAMVSCSNAEEPRQNWERRWIYLPINLANEDEMPRVEEILDRCQAAGYNGVLLFDHKIGNWWIIDEGKQWLANAQRFRDEVRSRNMELAVCVMNFGYSEAILSHDPNFASGLPVREAPMVRQGDELIPVLQAEFPRLDALEEHRGNEFDFADHQEKPGVITHVDTEERFQGKASLRIENMTEHFDGNGRVIFEVPVKPFQQYRVRYHVKAEGFSADQVGAIVLGDRDKFLAEDGVQFRHPDGSPEFVDHPEDFTLDWTEQMVSFNSLEETTANIYLGCWGGRSGRLWLDGVTLEAVPTLNTVRRDSLPISLFQANGTPLVEGRDFKPVSDSYLGVYEGVTGWFGTDHPNPNIQLPVNSPIAEGETVFYNGYHTAVVFGGQTCASMMDPGVFEVCAQEVQRAVQVFDPDVIFMGHDEIRVGGYEPSTTDKGWNAGQVLAENARICQELVRKHAPGKEMMIWSDMFDPGHNAEDDFYLTNQTFEGAWQGLEPETAIMKWLPEVSQPGLRLFGKRGHHQVIAAYYDADSVIEDRDLWQSSFGKTPNIDGVMYATFEEDYSRIEEFADAWWGGAEGARATVSQVQE